MKHFTLSFLLCMVSFCGFAQMPKATYNKQLADSLGADQYGMKAYVFVILKTGSATISEKSVVDSLFKGHMDNMSRLVAGGKLIVAGPFKKNDQAFRGLFILNVSTLDEAKLLLATDPAIKANLLEADLLQWYGSAALPMYLPFHSQVQKSDM